MESWNCGWQQNWIARNIRARRCVSHPCSGDRVREVQAAAVHSDRIREAVLRSYLEIDEVHGRRKLPALTPLL